MAKSRTVQAVSRKARRHGKSQRTSHSSRSSSSDPYTLLSEASQSLQSGNSEAALSSVQQAIALLKTSEQKASISLPAYTLLGEIQIELGDVVAAREAFKEAVEHDPHGSLPESHGGGAEKFLWLAQLSEEGGHDSIHWYERGIAVLEHRLGRHEASAESVSQADQSEELEEYKAKLASALCSMIEVWMTDLSLEPNAETNCERLIGRALLISDPPQASVLQTWASVLLSQSRFEDAQSALERSLDRWKELPPNHPDVPDFPTRISLARLLMEAEMEEVALEVVERLVGEDDESVEAWYLGGWCLWLMGNKQGNAEDADDRKSLLLSSREWLRNCLKLYDLLEYEDDKLRDHAVELVQGLDKELGDEEIEDDDDGWIDEGDADDTGGEDTAMNGT